MSLSLCFVLGCDDDAQAGDASVDFADAHVSDAAPHSGGNDAAPPDLGADAGPSEDAASPVDTSLFVDAGLRTDARAPAPDSAPLLDAAPIADVGPLDGAAHDAARLAPDASASPPDMNPPPPDAALLEPDAGPCAVLPRVLINEVVAANQTGYVDEDGDTPDWIELHNAGDEPVSLHRWGLSDGNDRFKWTLPEVTLGPGEHFVVLASRKDRVPEVRHWSTRIDWGHRWKYLFTPPPPDWVLPDGEFIWEEGPSGFGHGGGDDATEIVAHTIVVRTWIDLTPEEHADIEATLLHVDYDDGFVAYVNGVEVARANIPVVAPLPWAARASSSSWGRSFSWASSSSTGCSPSRWAPTSGRFARSS